VEEQGGFRAGRSTLDQIFTLHEILASRRERRQATFLAFLDCRRAYDRVWRDGLLLRLLQAGITGQQRAAVHAVSLQAPSGGGGRVQ
jgi:Reverse transcriptase (RNA-dependent DNA polymerase)